MGSSIIGTINGKFEEGYLVSVDCGSEKLQGILYHCAFSSPKLSRSPTSESYHQHRRKRKKRFAKDPSRPKSNRSGYNFFFAEQYAKLKPSFCGEEKSITRKIGNLWSNLTDVEREVMQIPFLLCSVKENINNSYSIFIVIMV